MTVEELQEIIDLLRRRGTDLEFVEAKSARTALPKHLWQTLSAFANQRGGGVIILGLDESQRFAAVGVDDPGKMQADLASLCDQMEPALRPLLRIHDFEGRQLVVAEVPEIPLEQKPCHYRGSGLYTGSFLRVGDGNRQLSQYEVHIFLEGRGQPAHDVEIVSEAGRNDLDPALLQEFLARVRRRRTRLAGMSDEELLKSLKVFAGEDKVTLAGLLCFARFPQQWFPSLTIAFLHYPGTQADQLGARGERFLDDRRFDGPLPAALDDALNMIVGAMRKRSLIQGLLRQEIPEYPPEAVREALVNAVAHRDYCSLARGSQVQVRMFQDRLEIQNPGGLFGPVNEDNLGQPGVQATRNQHLIQLLEDLGPAENRGTGIITMLRAMRQAQVSPPKMEDHRTHFRIVFSNDTMLDDSTIGWLNQFAALDLHQNQRLALAYSRHQKEISNSIYCRLTGADSREATTDLQDLVAKGLLRQLGTRRWTTYHLSSEDTESQEHKAKTREKISTPLTPAERQERICHLIAQKGALSARAISDELGVSRTTITYDLRKLVEGGRIIKTMAAPKDRRTRYQVLNEPGGL